MKKRRIITTCLVTLSALIALVISSSMEIKASKAHTESVERIATLRQLLASLENQSPNNYMFNTGAWNRFLTLSTDILKVQQSLRHGIAASHHPISLQTLESLQNIIDIQSSIRSHQNDFMKLKSLEEGISYRSAKPIMLSQQLVDAQLSVKKQSANISHSFHLNHALRYISLKLEHFWLTPNQHSTALSEIEQAIQKAKENCETLLEPKTGLKPPALRRAIVDIQNHIEVIKQDVAQLNKAKALLNKIQTLQASIKTLSSDLSIENALLITSDRPLSIYQFAAWISFASLIGTILYLIITELRDQPTLKPQHRQTELKPTITQQSKSLEEITEVIHKAYKGHLGLRLNERNDETGELSGAYNQMMSIFYKKIVAIHQHTKALHHALDSSESPDQDVANDHCLSPDTQNWIELTLQIAGVIDQIERKLKNNDLNGSSIKPYIGKIDELQALLRVKIREIDETQSQSAKNNTINASSERYKSLVDNIRNELNFFKLERKR